MNIFKRGWNWYKSHEKVQWGFILIPLWLQPLHMWAMAEQTAHLYGVINLDNFVFHLTNWNFWVDIFWLSIDYLEWFAIICATEKFVRYVRTKRAQKRLIQKGFYIGNPMEKVE